MKPHNWFEYEWWNAHFEKDFCNVYCKEAARRQTKYTSIITYVCACFARFYLRWLLLSKNHTCTVVLHYFSSTSPFAQSSRRWNCFVYTLCPLTSQVFIWVYIYYRLQGPTNLVFFFSIIYFLKFILSIQSCQFFFSKETFQ